MGRRQIRLGEQVDPLGLHRVAGTEVDLPRQLFSSFSRDGLEGKSENTTRQHSDKMLAKLDKGFASIQIGPRAPGRSRAGGPSRPSRSLLRPRPAAARSAVAATAASACNGLSAKIQQNLARFRLYRH